MRVGLGDGGEVDFVSCISGTSSGTSSGTLCWAGGLRDSRSPRSARTLPAEGEGLVWNQSMTNEPGNDLRRF